MITYFKGGPANGNFKDFPPDTTEVRCATPEMQEKGEAAVYKVDGVTMLAIRRAGCVATFTGMRKSDPVLVNYHLDFAHVD